MISISYPNPNKKVTVVPPTVTTVPPQTGVVDHNYQTMALARATKIGIDKAEWIRRDNIVRKQSKECLFNFGDTVYPTSEEGFNRYGKCLITGKSKTYAEMDMDKWPPSNVPFILSARPLDPDKSDSNFICTFNYFQKEQPL